ncbi:conserved hypothetical protein [Leishmania braziliensis MHOM/BR/75/M2904]|uniref:Uncharacterized protein n=2 Tax=Leishmania braziliensis TaxID=5660 RepID=A4HHW8_LEIBR|nr:conserved hypothetical protein [Leishmania braziliensis MHOM/BR/75/M2904]KAI5689619.1 hypothetical protein MNV84_05780 [Leishmania braziliensis]CAJ2476919.1 unnamed protein product [Leishmania braziliensis]CAJ2477439.1 unnamed protein product [Leishmania braziliensis]CAM40174.1 conserved hypothetical protein [Leishmania braziliensis MHOM/BR/75/M2904]SYZ67841.1 hypothetical_protein [Leishmania braziliensis MHOM/BR/75/M2904]
MKPALAPIPPRAPRCENSFQSPSGIRVAYTKDWVKQHPVEGDGLCAHLYQYLHKNVKGREHTMSAVLLPDTVVFDHNFPRAWYAYDSKNNEIVKRPGSMLDAQTMYTHFAESVKGFDVVAQFFHTSVNVEEEWKAVLTPLQLKTHACADQQLTYVEFFTADALHSFLFDQKRKPDGVLQKFIIPKGEGSSRHNFQLQVIWTPYITTVYRRTNRCRLTDYVVPLANRAATFDGAPYLSEETLVADETKKHAMQLCESIADHFYATEKKRLSRLILYVKTDDQNRTWVLWSSCIRVAPDAMNPTLLRVPMCLNMRTEVLNNGGSTLARLQARRHRQRQLLALDAELFELSRDFQFALTLNASHKRQAKALGLRDGGRGSRPQVRPTRWCGGEQVPVEPGNPLYPSFVALQVGSGGTASASVMLYGDGDSGSTQINRASAVSQHDGAYVAGGADEFMLDPVAQVQEELVALAMDAWYATYSTMLADDPHVMPTAHVELAAPLVGTLTPEELQGLVEVLGLLPMPSDRTAATSPVSSTGGALTTPRSHYVVSPYLVTSGRRLDRPSVEVELDVVSYLEELFRRRGDEISRTYMVKFDHFL